MELTVSQACPRLICRTRGRQSRERGRTSRWPFVRTVAGLFTAIGCLGLLGACQSLGPKSIAVGMPAYNIAIAQTSEQLMLLNIVRLRYSESPYFMEVSNVFASPFITATANASGRVGRGAANTTTIGAGLEYSEAPTIVYTPVSGEQFSRRMLEPVGLHNLGLLYRGGWNLFRIFALFVQRINEIPNGEVASGPTRTHPAPVYADFRRIAKTLDELELNGFLNVIAESREENRHAGKDSDVEEEVLIEFTIHPQAKQRPDVQQLFADLGLDPNAQSYFVTDQRELEPGRTITVVTRTPMATMYFLSKGVIVSQSDRARGVVMTTRDKGGEPFVWASMMEDLFTVQSSDTLPNDAYVSVRYRNSWFYILDNDVASKDTFVLFNMLVALRAGEASQVRTPVTVPVR